MSPREESWAWSLGWVSERLLTRRRRQEPSERARTGSGQGVSGSSAGQQPRPGSHPAGAAPRVSPGMRVLCVGSTNGWERGSPRDSAPEESRGQQRRERMKVGRLEGSPEGGGRVPPGLSGQEGSSEETCISAALGWRGGALAALCWDLHREGGSKVKGRTKVYQPHTRLCLPVRTATRSLQGARQQALHPTARRSCR